MARPLSFRKSATVLSLFVVMRQRLLDRQDRARPARMDDFLHCMQQNAAEALFSDFARKDGTNRSSEKERARHRARARIKQYRNSVALTVATGGTFGAHGKRPNERSRTNESQGESSHEGHRL